MDNQAQPPQYTDPLVSRYDTFYLILTLAIALVAGDFLWMQHLATVGEMEDMFANPVQLMSRVRRDARELRLIEEQPDAFDERVFDLETQQLEKELE